MKFSKRQEHSVDGPLLTFDLIDQIRALKIEKQWKTEGRDAITLVKSSSMRIILMILQQGSTLPEHSTDGTISVHVLSGSIEFVIKDKTTHLKASSLVTLPSPSVIIATFRSATSFALNP